MPVERFHTKVQFELFARAPPISWMTAGARVLHPRQVTHPGRQASAGIARTLDRHGEHLRFRRGRAPQVPAISRKQRVGPGRLQEFEPFQSTVYCRECYLY